MQKFGKTMRRKCHGVFFTNGHVLVNAEKMSKSKGNFLSLRHCCAEYGADATRFACADAGDSMEDANFSIDTANMGILRLTTEEEWIVSMLKEETSAGVSIPLRASTSPPTFADKVFLNHMNQLIALTGEHFSAMQWRDGLQTCFFEYLLARDTYRDACTKSGTPMRRDILMRYLETHLIMLSPITPHFCQHMWANVLSREGLVMDATWPVVTAPVDPSLVRAGQFLTATMRQCRESLLPKKTKKKATVPVVVPTHARVYLAESFSPVYQKIASFVAGLYALDSAGNPTFPEDVMVQLKTFILADAELAPQLKFVMKNASFIKMDALVRGTEAFELRMPFDQAEVLELNHVYLLKSLGLHDVQVFTLNDTFDESTHAGFELLDMKKVREATPGKPYIYMHAAPAPITPEA